MSLLALRGTLTHWKTKLLADALGIPPLYALGVLEALWHATAQLAPAGNIGRLHNKAIAMQMTWPGDPDVLIAALIQSGHLDVHEGRHLSHRLIVHDWCQHADYNTKRKAERHGLPVMNNDGTPYIAAPRRNSSNSNQEQADNRRDLAGGNGKRKKAPFDSPLGTHTPTGSIPH